MKNKLIVKFGVLVGVLVLLLIGFKYSDSLFQTDGGKVSEKKFEQMKDKDMEIIDTGVFIDEKLEKWYLENRKEKGEVVYEDKDHTYILVSLGKVKDPSTLLLLKGVKEQRGKLLVAYEPFDQAGDTSVDFPDDVRSSLIRVEGNYNNIQVVDVEE